MKPIPVGPVDTFSFEEIAMPENLRNVPEEFDIDKAMAKARRMQRFVVVLIVLGIGLVVILLFRLMIYEAGNTRLGAVLLYDQAMKRKDAEAAIHYAKKMIVLHNDNRTGYTELAFAYLLSEEPEKALETFESVEEYDEALDMYFRGGARVYPYYMGVARVYYKQGNRHEAFTEYCSALDDPRFQADNRSELIRDTVLCKHLSDETQNFSPFQTYEEFLTFIEEEFRKLGEPEHYAGPVDIFRRAVGETTKSEQEDR